MLVSIVKSNRGMLQIVCSYSEDIDTDEIDILGWLYSEFSVHNPKAKYQSKFADEFTYLITPTGKFPIGLIHDILKAIRCEYPTAKIVFDDFTKKLIIPVLGKSSLSDDFDLKQPTNTKYILRPHQEKSVRLSLSNNRGVLDLSTSAGKSLVISSIIENYWQHVDNNLKIMILVPTIQLVEQFHSDLIDYGIDAKLVGKFSGSTNNMTDDVKIVITNSQYVTKKLAELPKFGMLVVDECHQLSKNTNATKLVKSYDCKFKFGLTGSMPLEQEKIWNVVGATGRVLYTVKPHELQELGVVADTVITAVKFVHKLYQPVVDQSLMKDIEDDDEYARAIFPTEWRYIEAHTKSTDTILKFASKLNGNTIILFDHIEHGENFMSEAKFVTDKNLLYVDGTVKLKVREEIRTGLELSDNNLLFAQVKTFGTGINIKNINNIIFAFSSGYANAKIIQSVGRGLRLMDGKTHVKIFDFYHSFRYSEQHFEKRLPLYENNYQGVVKHVEIKV